MVYVIEYSPEAEDHLQWLTAGQQRTVVDAVERHLLNQLNMETRNRKPMRTNPVVYCELKDKPEPTVTILAIGIKERDQVRIGGERIKL